MKKYSGNMKLSFLLAIMVSVFYPLNNLQAQVNNSNNGALKNSATSVSEVPAVDITYPVNDQPATDYSVFGWFIMVKGTSRLAMGITVRVDSLDDYSAMPVNGSFDNWKCFINLGQILGGSGTSMGARKPPYGTHKITAINGALRKSVTFTCSQYPNFPAGSVAIIPAIGNKYGNDTIEITKGMEFWLDIKLFDYGNTPVGYNKIFFEMNYTHPEVLEYITSELGSIFPNAEKIVIPDGNKGKISAEIYNLNGGAITDTGVILKLKFKVRGNAQPFTKVVFNFPICDDLWGIYSRFMVINQFLQWPGDVNNDGEVNISDINPIINSWGKTGWKRPGYNITGEWQGYLRSVWDVNTEATYADCYGDGIVNIMDIDQVITFYGRSHPLTYPVISRFPKISDSEYPQIYLSGDVVVVKGDEVIYTVKLGTPDKPVEDLKVVSFELLFNKDLLEYIGNENGFFLTESNKVVIPDQERGKVSAAVYKLKGSNSGFGNIIQLKFRAKQEGNSEFHFDKVLANKSDGSIQNLSPVDFNNIVGIEKDIAIPAEYSLSQNYPNPFNPSTTISYSIPEAGFVSLIVYDLLGEEIIRLVNEEKIAGSYSVDFNGEDFSASVYFYTLQAGKFTETKKLMLIK